MERSIIHMILHFLVPFMVAKAGWRENWIRPFMIMALTMAVDFDHLLADPVFDPNRCGLGFHRFGTADSHAFGRNRLFVDLLEVSPFTSVKFFRKK
jgi:hypothetical protein